MKKNICIPIYRGFVVKHLGPTNYHSFLNKSWPGPYYFLGARIKIVDERYNQSVTIGYKYDAGNSTDQAMSYLMGRGFSVVAVVYMKKKDIILCLMDFQDLESEE